MRFFRYFWSFLIAPVWSAIIYSLAEGPWGRAFHQGLIDIYCRIFKIKKVQPQNYEKLADFFLRPSAFEVQEAKLVSPAESYVLESGLKAAIDRGIEVKGIQYKMDEFPELDQWPGKEAFVWNWYLSPKHYHWFHAPCDGSDVEIQFFSGQLFPVNSFGRWLCPFLYNENQRLSFRWQHPDLGRVIMMAVGAVGVSGIVLDDRTIPPRGRWLKWKESIQKADRLGAFKMGSSILLFVEKMPETSKLCAFSEGEEILVGKNLISLASG